MREDRAGSGGAAGVEMENLQPQPLLTTSSVKDKAKKGEALNKDP